MTQLRRRSAGRCSIVRASQILTETNRHLLVSLVQRFAVVLGREPMAQMATLKQTAIGPIPMRQG
jgi:hypothetical protein